MKLKPKMPKGQLDLFLLRFWAGVVFSMGIGLSWERHPPRLMVGMFVGAIIWLITLYMVTRDKG